MLSKLKQAWKIKAVRKKVMYTLMMIVIFRIGTTIPVPGIDTSIIQKMVGGNSLLSLYNMFTGGAFSNFSLFALGISPYITASIIIQLLTVGFESLAELQKSGEEGKKKINKYTKYTALALAVVQALGITLGIVRSALISNSVFFITTVVITLVSASMLVMWIGDKITEKGIGNGSSVIIFAGIISRIPTDVIKISQQVKSGEVAPWVIVILAVVILLTVTGVTFIQEATRKIPVQYAKRVVGRKMFMGPNAQAFVQKYLSMATEQGFWTYRSIEILLIIFFSYFYTTVSFNTEDISKNMKNNGGFIPGIRPGEPTMDYLNRILTRLTLAGATFLAIIAMVPALTTHYMKVNMSLAGTSLLIVVGVALELKRQLESNLVMRSYQGFLK